jgi:AcrR family transcriptional regulator
VTEKAGRFDRRTEIIEKATELFGRHGYEKVKVREIAETCGVTEAALYRHFRSKDAIYVAVLESLESRLVDDEFFAGLGKEQDVESLLTGLASHIISFFTENNDIYRLLLYSALEGHERAKRVFDLIRGRYVRFLKRQLDLMHEAGHIVPKNNEITARCFIGMVFDCALGFSLWRGMQGRVHEPSRVIANNVPIYVNGLKKG